VELALFRAGGLEVRLQHFKEAFRGLREGAESLRQAALAADFPGAAQKAWKGLCEEVYAGRAEKAQAAQADFEERLTRSVAVLKQACDQLEEAAQHLGPTAPSADEPRRHLAELMMLREGTVARWKTQEDLEDLAAQEYPLSRADLQQLAKDHPVPPEWLAREEPRPW
jgi:hypothetical protein